MAREVKAKKSYVISNGDEHVKAGKQSYFPEATLLRFQFANGSVGVVDPGKLNDTIRTAAMFHGLSQKLGDCYAGAKDVDEAEENFLSLLERLEAGEWLAERESAGPRISLVIKAIVAAKARQGSTVTEEDVAAKYHAMSKEAQKSLLKDPRINAEYQRIRAEQAAERAAKAAAAVTGEASTEALDAI